MFPFPDFLYKLTVQDLGSPWARIFRRRVDATLAAVNVPIDLTTPDDRMLLMTHAAGLAIPGAAQNVVDMGISYGIPLLASSGNMRLKTSNAALAVGIQGAIDWQGCVLLPPGTQMRCNCNYNAGVAGNTTALMVSGVTFPVGTIQLP